MLFLFLVLDLPFCFIRKICNPKNKLGTTYSNKYNILYLPIYRPKNPNGSWELLSDFPGYSKKSTLMIEMKNPIHQTGKIVSMDSGFCVSVGIIAMHDYGVYGQFLIMKRRYWPKNVPRDAIDSYFANKELGSAKTFSQVINKKPFLVHCHKDDRYVRSGYSVNRPVNWNGLTE